MRRKDPIADEWISNKDITMDPLREKYLVFGKGNINLEWYPWEVQELKEMWREGYSILEISNRFDGRDPDECFLLIFDLIRLNLLRRRSHGLAGAALAVPAKKG